MTDPSSHWCCEMLTYFKLFFCLYFLLLNQRTELLMTYITIQKRSRQMLINRPYVTLLSHRCGLFVQGSLGKGVKTIVGWSVTYSHVIVYFQLLWKASTFLKTLFWSVIVLKCSRHFNRKRYIMGIFKWVKTAAILKHALWTQKYYWEHMDSVLVPEVKRYVLGSS